MRCERKHFACVARKSDTVGKLAETTKRKQKSNFRINEIEASAGYSFSLNLQEPKKIQKELLLSRCSQTNLQLYSNKISTKTPLIN